MKDCVGCPGGRQNSTCRWTDRVKSDHLGSGRYRLRVLNGGGLSDNKGINLPGDTVSASSLTVKEIEDVRFAMSLGVDYLALPFVWQAQDIEDLRQVIGDTDILVIA